MFPHLTTRQRGDLEIPGRSETSAALWQKDLVLLADPGEWPPQFVTSANATSDAGRKVQQELFEGVVEESNNVDRILKEFGLNKARRTGDWVLRF